MKLQLGNIIMKTVSKKGGIYENRTFKYLIPCIKSYGEEFVKKIESVYKVAIGIGDIIVMNRDIKHEKHLFILLDSSILPMFFQKFIFWIREQPMYEDDYVFGNIQNSPYHMLVIKIPEKYVNSLAEFKKGKYSKMYSKEEIMEMFSNKDSSNVKILLRDKSYKFEFTKKLNKLFGTNLTVDDIEDDHELDVPINLEEEIFNYHLKQSNDGAY